MGSKVRSGVDPVVGPVLQFVSFDKDNDYDDDDAEDSDDASASVEVPVLFLPHRRGDHDDDGRTSRMRRIWSG